MKEYLWVLFDADDTLFHFDAFGGLQKLFNGYGWSFTDEDYQEYQAINKPLWVAYQQGQISAQYLQEARFSLWAERLSCTPAELNRSFLAIMTQKCAPIDGAKELLTALKPMVKLAIITNGFTELQEARLQYTGFKHFFDLLVISEQVGVAKPNPKIFEHALALMGQPPREQVLIVGDNLDSDILGGLNAGIDTCWFNPENKILPAGVKPHYQVSSLKELEHLLTASLIPV